MPIDVFEKIVCPIDFSAGSDDALVLAARMAKQAHAELVIAHVGGMPWLISSRYPLPVELVESLLHEQDAGLASASREAVRLGTTRVSTCLMNGVAWDEIVRFVENDRRIDLVVIGTHGRSAISRVLLGSVAEKVVRHAPCSVLAARRHETAGFRHILCPIDFSDGSHHALDTAAALVAPGGAGITLFHSVELPVIYGGEATTPDLFADLDKRRTHAIEEWAEALRKRVAVPVSTVIEVGSAGARALDVLERDPSYDLVVVGSHGRTGLRRVLLGSVAETIVRHAACSVLVARRRRIRT